MTPKQQMQYVRTVEDRSVVAKFISTISSIIGFTICILMNIISTILFISALAHWGWTIYSYLRFGAWDRSAEIWVQANLKPIFAIDWIGVSIIVRDTTDFIFEPLSRFIIGLILAGICAMWMDKWDNVEQDRPHHPRPGEAGYLDWANRTGLYADQ